MQQDMWPSVDSQCLYNPRQACSLERQRLERHLLIVVPPDPCVLGEALVGLARTNEQLSGSPRFSLDPTRQTWYTFAHGERQQSEGDVAFQVNAGGRAGDCKIACLSATCVPILLSVLNRSKMEAIVDFSTGSALFRNLTDQGFCTAGEKTTGVFFFFLGKICYLNRFWRMTSCLDSKRLQGFLKNLNKQGQHPRCSLVDGETSEVEKKCPWIETCVLPHLLTAAVRATPVLNNKLDKLPQTTCRQAPHH